MTNREFFFELGKLNEALWKLASEADLKRLQTPFEDRERDRHRGRCDAFRVAATLVCERMLEIDLEHESSGVLVAD